MNLRLSILLFCFTSLFHACAQNDSTMIGNTRVYVDTLASGLDIPWEIILGPDNDLWVTERKGIISSIDLETRTKSVLLDLSQTVYDVGESGMLGMALHPNFISNPEVFFVYTYFGGGAIKERLVKYQFSDDSLINGLTLIDNIPGNQTHNGSRLLFMDDGTLLMTTGDARISDAPQDSLHINGKILRINTDGTVPADNPYPGSYTFSWGHRNAQGLCFGPNGNIYISEHGPNSDDEFQILAKGRNYGWPEVYGFCDQLAEQSFCANHDVMEPMKVWTPTIAPSDIVYYENASFPEWDQKILLSTLKFKRILTLELNQVGDSVTGETGYLINQFGRIRDLCIGPNKEIYIATNGADWANNQPNSHAIIRLSPPGSLASVTAVEDDNIKLYPNPSNGIVFLSGITKAFTYQVLNINGQVMAEGIDNTSINLSKLTNGLYYLKVSYGSINRYFKVLLSI